MSLVLQEETPPATATDDDTKEEKTKLVPTSEQLRLAQITQSQDNSADPQRKAKISQVMDITGKTEDEVATALFDCGWDTTRVSNRLVLVYVNHSQLLPRGCLHPDN